MFMEWKNTCTLKFFNKTTLFYCFFFFFFFSVFALFTTLSCTTPTCSDIKSPLTAHSDLHFQDLEKTTSSRSESENSKDDDEFEEGGGGDMIVSIGRRRSVISLSLARRYLSGPGSSPPRCTSKCGSCRPCRPVHVPVPPGTPVTAEYYPEAWRCKCGNRLYMP